MDNGEVKLTINGIDGNTVVENIKQVTGLIEPNDNVIPRIPSSTIPNPAAETPMDQEQLNKINDAITELRTDHDTMVQALKAKDADHSQYETELHELATHINELTADKQNKQLKVQSKIYLPIRIDKPDPEPTTDVIPGPYNHIGLWKVGQKVDLTLVDNGPHLWFLLRKGIAYPLVIKEYENSSDPIRLEKLDIPVGIVNNAMELSVTGENAPLKIVFNGNPDDIGQFQLIKWT